MNPKRYIVEFTKFAATQAGKLPVQIHEALYLWKESVEHLGLAEVRKAKGYHDEPLKGQRKGQRSVRLNRAYRLIYDEFENGEIVVVSVQEVNKHEY
jgi:proteic killer suppression protein